MTARRPYQEDRLQSELRFAAHSKEEKTAGVWVDGQLLASPATISAISDV